MNVAIFKNRIKEQCNKYGITQKHLCDVIGKGKQFLNNVWDGKCGISTDDLNTIAQALHTTPEYLKGETDISDEPEKKQIDISDVKVALFGGGREVTDEMWDEVKNFVDYVIQKHSKGDK